MESFAVSSLQETSLSEDYHFCSVIYNTITTTSDRFALTSPGMRTVGGYGGEALLTWRDEGSTLVEVLVATVVPGADEVLERTRRWLCALLLLLQKGRPYEVSMPPSEGEN